MLSAKKERMTESPFMPVLWHQDQRPSIAKEDYDEDDDGSDERVSEAGYSASIGGSDSIFSNDDDWVSSTGSTLSSNNSISSFIAPIHLHLPAVPNHSAFFFDSEGPFANCDGPSPLDGSDFDYQMQHTSSAEEKSFKGAGPLALFDSPPLPTGAW